jgi:hypothetical protein
MSHDTFRPGTCVSTVALNESPIQTRLHISIIFLFRPNCKCTQILPTEEFLCGTKGRLFRPDLKVLLHRQNQRRYFPRLLPDCCESLAIMKEKIHKHRGKTHIRGRRFGELMEELSVDLVVEVRSRLQVRIQRKGERIDSREI